MNNTLPIVDKKIHRARIVSRLTTWILRLLVLLTIGFFLAVLLAAGLGGNGDIQRQSLENVISRFLGAPAHIHQLNMYQIFPTQRIDFEKMVVIEDDAREPRAILERGLYISDPIASWMGGNPITDIQFKNFITRPGFWGPQSLHLENGKIITESNGQTQFVMTGRYGAVDLKVLMPMVSMLEDQKNKYRFKNDTPIQIKFDDLGIEFFLQLYNDKIIIDPLTITRAHHQVKGSIIIPRSSGVKEKPVFKIVDELSGVTVSGTLDQFNDKVQLVGKIYGSVIDIEKTYFIIEMAEKIVDIFNQKKSTTDVNHALVYDFSIQAQEIIPCENHGKSFKNLQGHLKNNLHGYPELIFDGENKKHEKTITNCFN